jgi:GrpB-like predicted nucleotidyltransferase (UPF0157 family)
VNAAEQAGGAADPGGLTRHPSLDERLDPAVRIVDYDPAWVGRAEQLGSGHERRHLAVRDFLRSHEEEAIRYEALKRLATRSPWGAARSM